MVCCWSVSCNPHLDAIFFIFSTFASRPHHHFYFYFYYYYFSYFPPTTSPQPDTSGLFSPVVFYTTHKAKQNKTKTDSTVCVVGTFTSIFVLLFVLGSFDFTTACSSPRAYHFFSRSLEGKKKKGIGGSRELYPKLPLPFNHVGSGQLGRGRG